MKSTSSPSFELISVRQIKTKIDSSVISPELKLVRARDGGGGGRGGGKKR